MSDNSIQTIRMAHPNRNALDEQLIGWLDERLDEAAERPVLLTGSEDAFCAGLNLRRVAELDVVGMEAFLRRLDELVRRLFLYPAPTVALVNGHAIAGGCVLALACDHRVVRDDPGVRIGLNEVALGACFPPRIMKLVQATLSPRHLERAILGARLFGPDEARDIGFVDEVSDRADELALQRLEELAAHPRRTYAITKSVLRGPAIDVDAKDEQRFVDDEVPVWTSAETRRRVLAILGG